VGALLKRGFRQNGGRDLKHGILSKSRKRRGLSNEEKVIGEKTICNIELVSEHQENNEPCRLSEWSRKKH